jgi:uncharacterized protein (TIGR00661 family)
MRILYGVFGYGRGHATRALAVLGELRRRHEVLILAGGDAHDAVASQHPVTRIPTLRYEYDARGKRSLSRTMGENLRHVADILLTGSAMHEVERLAREFAPRVAVCDAEPWTHTAAARLGVPRISFDHYGILAYAHPPIGVYDRLRTARDVYAYRALMGRPERVIVSSFYEPATRDPGVRFVGPLLRDEVLGLRAERGDHVLAYLNRGDHQLTPRVEDAMRRAGVRFIVYGTRRRGVDGCLDFRAPAGLPFLRDLAGARAVLSTAGNQLVGEAMWLGKPLLVMPENTVEQRLNAAAIERMGIGIRASFDDLAPTHFEALLVGEERMREAALRQARDGRAEALAALDAFTKELVALPRPRVALPVWRPA